MERKVKVTLEGFDFPIELEITKNRDWVDHLGLDAYVCEDTLGDGPLGGQKWTGPTPGLCLDVAIKDAREWQEALIADIVEKAERKAGWDPNP